MKRNNLQKHLVASALALSLAVPALALTPLPACNVDEGGMIVANATNLGLYNSGLLLEDYRTPKGADGPIPELNGFDGFRVTDCSTGMSLAVHGVNASAGNDRLLATDALSKRVARGAELQMRQVQRAADAVFGKDGTTRVLRLRFDEEPCACKVFYPGDWKN